MSGLVSIIVPVYNTEKYLGACIQSVLAQTYQNLELILINDGSTDGSGKICEEWASKDARVRCFSQENAGVGAARNRGLREAKGIFVAFLDSDDYLNPNFCGDMVLLMGKQGQIAFCVMENLYLDGRRTPPKPAQIKTSIYASDDFEYWEEKEKRSSCGALFRKSLLTGLSFSQSLYVGEDTLFVAQAVRRTQWLIYSNAPLYTYRILENSAYHGKFDLKKKSEVDAWLQVCQVFPEGSPSRRSADALCAEICVNMIRNYVDDPGFDEKIIRELIGVYRQKLPQLIRFDRSKHRSCWKHIAVGLIPRIFVKRQRKAVKKGNLIHE